MAAPFREIEFDILYNEGISKLGDMLDLATNENIIEKSGSWFAYENMKIGQGRENAKVFLKENPSIAQEVYQKLCVKLKVKPLYSDFIVNTAPVAKKAEAAEAEKKPKKIMQ